MERIKAAFDLLKTTFNEWNQDNAPMMAAALAYYTAFSMAPLIIIVVSIFGLVVSQSDVQARILGEIEGAVGTEAAGMIGSLIDNMTQPGQGFISSALGVIGLLLGALGLFSNLQNALNRIWNVDDVEREGGIRSFVKDKLLSFSMILVIGFLLLVSLVLSTLLTLLDNHLLVLFPGSTLILRILNFVLSFGMTTLLFMAIYKILPHAAIEWRDVWVGAAITALLFTIGRALLGLYLGNTAVASAYGAAGALAVVLLWVNYSAQIVLFGAEFTQVFARRYGSCIEPAAPSLPTPSLTGPDAETETHDASTHAPRPVTAEPGRREPRPAEHA